MARGGKRKGAPGKAYSQRVDLQGGAQAVRTAPGQAYGAAEMQRQMQAVAPVAGTAVPPQPTAAPPGAAAPAMSGPTPGMGFADPTGRPDEPVMAGAPVGPGGGPELLGQPGGQDSELRMRLGALYAAMPTEEIRSLIEMLDEDLV